MSAVLLPVCFLEISNELVHINRAITLLSQKLSGLIFRVNLSEINIRLLESLYITVFRFKISPHFSRSLQEVTQEFFYKSVPARICKSLRTILKSNYISFVVKI